ncbi:hypothetical protein CEXT_446061 [Caerostris extrusa]|uniref:Uncharacterized protein n=1 Tax=Caerostris extrusa TaxID=172846 RepID=A0AAV4UT05_CAEEX|nr:hypothetical protein CEXT_446061 [Caerostris extrusa]
MEPGKYLQRCCKSRKNNIKFPEESFFKELSNHLFFSQKSSTDRVTTAPGQMQRARGPKSKTASGIRLLSHPKLKKPVHPIISWNPKSLQRCCKRQKKKNIKFPEEPFFKELSNHLFFLPEIFHSSSNSGSRAKKAESARQQK